MLTARRLLAICLALCATFAAQPALADHVVVKRHVTLRAEPVRTSQALDFPEIGATLKVLDGGQEDHKYYHVRDGAGHEGWIYSTFVELVPDVTGVTPEALLPPSGQVMQVHYINVDQGAAALIEFPCAAIMIDAGGRTGADTAHILNYLQEFFARRTDLGGKIAAVFVTHTHIDHDLSLKAVGEAYPIAGYIENGAKKGSGLDPAKWMRSLVAAHSGAIGYDPVSETDVLAAGTAGLTNSVIDPVKCQGVDPDIRVLSGRYDINPGWPQGEFDKNGNLQSLVIKIVFGKASFLFTGDLEDTAIDTLLDHWQGTTMLDADVWQVGHHGSYNGATSALLAAITPKVAVIQMGRETPQEKWTAWDYGHPRRVAIDLLTASLSETRPPKTVRVADAQHVFSDYHLTKAIYATGWDGDVTVRADATGSITPLLGQ